MLAESTRVASVKLNRNVVAVCEWATYDVWGNARDGYDVNDVYRQGTIEIPAEATLHNLPRLPKDDSGSSSDPAMFVSYVLTDRAIKKALDVRCRFDVDGDDTTHYLNRRSDGKPMAEIRIVGWKESD